MTMAFEISKSFSKTTQILYNYFIFYFSSAMEKLINNQRMEIISVIRLTLDLIQAGSTLPKGYFWGGKLENVSVGLVSQFEP